MSFVQAFVWFDGLVVLSLIAFLLRRPKGAGARLRLQKSLDSSKTPVVRDSKFGDRPGRQVPQSPQPTVSQNPSRQLTVNFNYNGHSWEAYEVLGVPAGASFDRVEEAFEVLAIKTDVASLPFFVAALEAIRELHSKG